MRRFLALSVALVYLIAVFSATPAAGQTLQAGATEAAHSQPVDTFTVTVEDRSAEHPYQDGFQEVFVVDGVQGKELTMVKGETYLFQMDDVPSVHPFYLTTSAIGFGEGTYDEGVEGNGAVENEQLTFTPPTDAPDSLWYQCVNHSKMGWRMALTESAARASVNSDGAVTFDGTGLIIEFFGIGGSGEVSVSKFNSAPEGQEGIGESNVSDYRFAVRAAADLTVGADTELRFDASTLGGIGDGSNVTVYRRDSTGTGSFSALETTYDAEANELAVVTGEFSEFVFASDSEPLPVELTAFDAQVDGRAVDLSWHTASETNNAGFEVQRKGRQVDDGGPSWTPIGFVESKASDADSPSSYQFRDSSLPFDAERVTYRLKQVDVDGSTHFSDPVALTLDGRDRLALAAPFPNPATRSATIRYELPRAMDVTLELYNTLGQRVATLAGGRQSAGPKEVQFDVPDVASGTYLVRLVTGTQVRTQNLTVVK